MELPYTTYRRMKLGLDLVPVLGVVNYHFRGTGLEMREVNIRNREEVFNYLKHEGANVLKLGSFLFYQTATAAPIFLLAKRFLEG